MCGSTSYMSCGYERCHVVGDQFFVGSLTKETRKKRKHDGSAMQFTGGTQFPSNFGDFFSNSLNKNNSQFVAHKLLLLHGGSSSLEFVVTLKDTILTYVQNDISYCTPEEANPRLTWHAIINQANNGLENITNQIIDSNVLVLSLSSVKRLIQTDVKSLSVVLINKDRKSIFLDAWISFSKSTELRYIFIQPGSI